MVKKYIIVTSLSVLILLTGCGSDDKTSLNNLTTSKPSVGNLQVPPIQVNKAEKLSSEEIEKIKPNEAGKVMVVMFHNFVENFTPTKYDKGEYTTTFDEFEKLLNTLYEKDYRLINVNDYLDKSISVPAGKIPMMFTFDDGTSGQFNLIEENAKLAINPRTAIGILEKFNKTHPDFGLKGTFYVNLGLGTFEGKGTVQDRLKYLVDKGFEIGNHTFTHIHLNQAKTAEEITKEIGKNQQAMSKLIPGYQFKSLALPFGQATKSLKSYVEKGEYEGVKYQNFAIMEVGAEATQSPFSAKSNPLSMSRVRSTGIKPVDCDLQYWLKNLSKSDQFISDGNSQIVTVTNSKEAIIKKESLGNRKVVTY